MQLYSKLNKKINKYANFRRERGNVPQILYPEAFKQDDRFKSLFRPLKITIKFNTQCVKCRSDSHFKTSPVPDIIEALPGVKETETESIVPVNEDQLRVIDLSTKVNVLAKNSTDKTNVMSKNKLYLNCLMPVPFLNEQEKLYLADDELSLNSGRLSRDENDFIPLLQKSTTDEHKDKLPLDMLTRDEDNKLALLSCNFSDVHNKLSVTLDKPITDANDSLPFISGRYSTDTVDQKKISSKLTPDGDNHGLPWPSDKLITDRITQDLSLNKYTINEEGCQLPLKKATDDEDDCQLSKVGPTTNKDVCVCQSSSNKSVTDQNDYQLYLEKCIIDDDDHQFPLEKPITDKDGFHSSLEKPATDNDDCHLSLDEPATDENTCQSSLDNSITDENDCHLSLNKPVSDKDGYKPFLDLSTSDEGDNSLDLGTSESQTCDHRSSDLRNSNDNSVVKKISEHENNVGAFKKISICPSLQPKEKSSTIKSSTECNSTFLNKGNGFLKNCSRNSENSTIISTKTIVSYYDLSTSGSSSELKYSQNNICFRLNANNQSTRTEHKSDNTQMGQYNSLNINYALDFPELPKLLKHSQNNICFLSNANNQSTRTEHKSDNTQMGQYNSLNINYALDFPELPKLYNISKDFTQMGVQFNNNVGVIEEKPPEENSVPIRVLIGIALKSKVGFYDAHCHLDILFDKEEFEGTFEEYQRRNGFTFPRNYKGCIATFCKPSTFTDETVWTKYMSQRNVWATFGCHPCNAHEFDSIAEHNLQSVLSNPKVKGLGEIGLDYSTR
ncbi:putative deoxyribonuclease TATDN2 [Trichonephila clavata]|uniref:Putative deoxyribonuclease TATDN2 n=1 Tax=Trichonephila clavata TaxID=2740835 RepID=A0A8X6M4U2_TRICU|nr:putative deoxyribonuclease TATDN2 [Trichonephila clavata]